MNKIRQFIAKHPLWSLLIIGGAIRLFSALLSGGYYAQDDHFLVLETSQSWVMGEDVANWFVDDYEKNTSGRSVLYPGLHYLLFKGLEGIGIVNPLSKMIFVKLLHAFFSLLVVWLVYKIAEVIRDKKTAFETGLIIALLWCFPFFGIRNLVETFCIPPLLGGTYLLIKKRNSRAPWTRYLCAGLLLGISFSIRYQTALISLGFFIVLLTQKQWQKFIWAGLGMTVFIGLFHGIGDYYQCTVPFGKILYYIQQNIQFSQSYLKEPWYWYLLLIPLFLVPLLGFFWLWGFFKSRKVNPLMFWGSILFLAFHSFLENKQERFILTIIPFILILGYIKWNDLLANSTRLQKFKKGFSVISKIGWTLNILLLLLISPYYSKKARILAGDYLWEADSKTIIIENSTSNAAKPFPTYYAGNDLEVYQLLQDDDATSLFRLMDSLQQPADHILFEVKEGQPASPAQLDRVKAAYPNLKYIKTFEMGNIDKIRFRFNPRLRNFDYAVYKVR